jgi:hypothetical protein
MGHAVAHLEAGRRLHPRVQRQNPHRRHGGAEGDEEGGRRMHPVRHAAETEQHDSQENRLEEEGRQHLVGEQRPGDISDRFHEARPVGAELEAHRDAGDDAQSEGEREHLHPEEIGAHPGVVAGAVVAELEEQQHPAERDGDGGEKDVEGDVRAELDARENERIEIHAGSPFRCPGQRNDAASSKIG